MTNTYTIDLGYQRLVDILINGWEAPDDEVDDEDDEKFMPLDGDETVIRDELIRIHYDYPLTNPVIRTHTIRGGFTRKDLAEIVANDYQVIYDEETNSISHTPPPIRGLINRPRTNGVHGIWGHVIDDLVLHTARYDNGDVLLGLDS